MVLTILKWVGIAMVLSLIALWLWEGGYWKIAKYAQIIPNPLNATSTDPLYQLPGQPDFFQVPDTTSGSQDMEYGSSDYQNPSDALTDPRQSDPRAHGERSPYADTIDLQIGGAQNSNPNDEYVVIHMSDIAPVAVAVSGWTIRSALSGARAVVPLAASPFMQGVVNRVDTIVLSGGESVILSSGTSPLGVSFRETTCTGYLAQTQRFSPALSNACPRPTDQMPRTSDIESRFGASCIDFVERLPQCSYPTIIPNDVTPSCRSFLANTLTYSGCMRSYGSGQTENLNTWRVYESSASELWNNERDTLILYDADGRAVSTLSY